VSPRREKSDPTQGHFSLVSGSLFSRLGVTFLSSRVPNTDPLMSQVPRSHNPVRILCNLSPRRAKSDLTRGHFSLVSASLFSRLGLTFSRSKKVYKRVSENGGPVTEGITFISVTGPPFA
jgi:hypothetical protein